MNAPKIQLRELRLEYVNEERGERHLAVDGIDLDIYSNEFLCLVGPSGCGKSTILASIAGFLPPTGGEILMNGGRVTKPGADRGVVFQEYALLPWLRVIDNVAFGLKMRGMGKAERHAVARQFLAIAGLSNVAEKYPHELSGGMKQRVAVIRTLANKPEVMLMDEPFAAIDAQTRMVLQEELVRIWASSRITVLFVTHSVEEAVFLGDRVAVMTPGPGRVRDIVQVSIPRERRQWNLLGTDPEFNRLKDQVLGLVRKVAVESP
jgi:NitT/TauT family transport system ATP-binding protein